MRRWDSSGRFIVRFGRGVALAMAAVVALVPARAIAADSPPSILPPSLTAAPQAAAQLNQIFSSCTAMPIMQQLLSLASRSPGTGSLTAVRVCDGPEALPESSLSCAAFQVGGVFESRRVDAMVEQAKKVEETLACKKNKLQGIEAEVKCFQSKAGLLQAQVNQLQSVYTNYLQQAQQQVENMNGTIRDRTAQLEDVKTKLDGGDRPDGSSVGKGMRQALAEVSKLKGEIRASVAGIREQYQVLEAQRAAYKSMIARDKATQAFSCLASRPLPEKRDAQGFNSFSCDGVGKSASSAVEYALCRVEQRAREEGGSYAQDANSIYQAKARRAALEDLFRKIQMDIPQSTGVPTTPEEVRAAGKASVRVLTPKDLQVKYGAALAGFGPDVQRFILSSFQSCYDEAATSIAKARKDENSQYGATMRQMQNAEQKIRELSNAQSSAFTERYNDAVRALTGDGEFATQLNCQVSVAKSAFNPEVPLIDPEKHLACLENQRLSVDRLLEGGDKVGLLILGSTKPETALPPLQCTGLAGCVKALENASRNLSAEVKRQKENKRGYIAKANQQIDKFTADMARMLEPQSKALREHLDMIKSALSSLGVSGLGGVEGIQPASLKQSKDEDGPGLYEIPESALSVIGGKTKPPFPDLDSPQALDGYLEGISSAVNGVKEKEQRVVDQLANIKDAAESCKSQVLDRAVSAFEAQAGRATECFDTEEACKEGSKLSLNALLDQVREIIADSGRAELDPLTGALEGIPGCNDPNRGRMAKQEREKAECERIFGRESGERDFDKAQAIENRKNCLAGAEKNFTLPPPSNCKSITTGMQKQLGEIRRMTQEPSGSSQGARH